MSMMNRDSEALADPILRELIQQFPLAMAVLDDVGRPAFLNDRFERTYGREMLYSEPLRALVRKPLSGWQNIQVPSREQPVIQFKAHVLHFHGNPILIVDDTEDPVLVRQLGELRAQITELEKLSSTDALTGVWNRAHLDRVIGLELDRSLGLRQPLSLILMDIDHFKKINDTHGHLVGDAVLCELTRVVGATIRSADSLFRWGGEEFVVLASSTGYRGAAKVAEKVRSDVERHRFAGVGALTISLGVAEHVASEPAEVWFSRADAALYRAKDRGRNRVCVDRRGCSDLWASASASAVLRLIWQEAYECGEPTIDREHRDLFESANSLLDASAGLRTPPDVFNATLNKVLEHIARHFADEEAILARREYKRLEDHKAAHARLLSRAEELKASALAGTVTLGTLTEFLANAVVTEHLLKADADYFPLFRESIFRESEPGRHDGAKPMSN